MKKEKIFVVMFICAISVLLLTSMVSAGIGEWIKKTITGKATSRTTNVSVTVSGDTPVTVNVNNGTFSGGITPNEATSKSVTFYSTVCDPDGVDDINDSSVQSGFIKTGESTRNNLSCAHVSDIDSNCANFSCTIELWYWDGFGDWNINVSAKDNGNKTRIANSSMIFNYNQLKAMMISPESLTWPVLSPGDINQTSNNDPTVINNTGNYNGTIDITGLNLIGETITSEYIPANNFSADIDTGAEAECDGTLLVNGTAQTISGSDANRGNLSAGSGAGQEEVYYCLKEMPSLPTQTYSTQQGGSWLIAY